MNGGFVAVDADVDGLFASTNSFGTDITVENFSTAMWIYQAYIAAQPDRGITNGPVLDVDHSGGTYDGRLYLAWADADTLPNTDIFLSYSDDEGATWSSPTTVEDSTGSDFLPWVDVDQTTGSVNVIYYTTDGDQSTGNDDVQVRLATSLDGGDTFSAANISTQTSNETGGYGGDYLEYIGLAVHDGTAHGLWSSRVSGGGTDLEALAASASFSSSSDGNLLTVEGDDTGATDDEILVQLNEDNADFLEVYVNEELQFAGLLATIDEILIDGLAGNNTIVVDPDVSSAVLVDVQGVPQVIDLTISGSSSVHDPYSFDENDADGSGEQLRTVPVGGADAITLAFSEDVTVTEEELTIIGLRTGNQPEIDSFSTDGTTATWTFTDAFDAGQYLIKLSDGVVDSVGNMLDGEWFNPESLSTAFNSNYTFPSGDGSEGGDFDFVFNILPADFNRDLSVGFIDYNIWLAAGGTDHAHGDANGDGSVGFGDYNIWLNSPTFVPGLATLDIVADLDGSDYDVDQDDVDAYDTTPVDFDHDLTAGDTDDDAIMAAFAAFGIDLNVFESTPPQVVDVTISGSSSVHDPYSFDDNNADGSGEQLRTVPVGGADTIMLTFSESVTVAEEDLSIIGLRWANQPTIDSFSTDGTTATWVFDSPLAEDQYLIKLADDVTDAFSNVLDGDWFNPESLTTSYNANYTFPSGDGTAGGDFDFVFTILPADFNRNNSVGVGDYNIWLSYGGPGPASRADGDANGDGSVGIGDYIAWLNSPGGVSYLDIVADLHGSDYDVDQDDVDAYDTTPVDFDHDLTAGDTDDDAIMAAFAAFGIDLNVFT